MADLYSNLKTVSTSLIRQFGSKCVIVHKTAKAYNPETSSVTGETLQTEAFCLFDTLAYDFSRQTANSDVEIGDVAIMLTAEAKLNDIIQVNGEQWQVIRVQAVKPAATSIYWQVQGRLYG